MSMGLWHLCTQLLAREKLYTIDLKEFELDCLKIVFAKKLPQSSNQHLKKQACMLSIYNVMSMIISLNKASVKKIFKPDQQQLISIKILNEWVDILRAFL
jgi:hypothetical protein